uniref:Uncharacterized protein n=1 Tax=Oryza sativa subsp. japonica TaxID=39947 RepID=Q6ZG64_ORYSJ|nr:hypothetical protein [Oryza sativa Japonica Group]
MSRRLRLRYGIVTSSSPTTSTSSHSLTWIQTSQERFNLTKKEMPLLGVISPTRPHQFRSTGEHRRRRHAKREIVCCMCLQRCQRWPHIALAIVLMVTSRWCCEAARPISP